MFLYVDFASIDIASFAFSHLIAMWIVYLAQKKRLAKTFNHVVPSNTFAIKMLPKQDEKLDLMHVQNAF